MQPGVSMASVAMSRGINANLLRRWVRAAEMGTESTSQPSLPAPKASTSAAAFVPLSLPGPKASGDVRIELRRGAMAVLVTWPADAAMECATWMRELLR